MLLPIPESNSPKAESGSPKTNSAVQYSTVQYPHLLEGGTHGVGVVIGRGQRQIHLWFDFCFFVDHFLVLNFRIVLFGATKNHFSSKSRKLIRGAEKCVQTRKYKAEIKNNKNASGTVQHIPVQYSPVHYNAIQYNTIQYNTIQYNTLQSNTVYNTTQ